MVTTIKFPLINPNEPEALLIEVFVEEGQKVNIGDLLCSLETTKSTQEVIAQQSGYIIGLQNSIGDIVKAGDILAYVSENPEWKPPAPKTSKPNTDLKDDLHQGFRISQPALEFVRLHKIDLSKFSKDDFITLDMVKAELELSYKGLNDLDIGVFDATSIVIYGAGGHGKSILDFLKVLGNYHIVGFIDDGIPAGEIVYGHPVLGGKEILSNLYNRGLRMAINAVGGIGNLRIREKVFSLLEDAGIHCPTIIHPTAFVEDSALLSEGSQVFPLAYVGTDVKVGFGSIINTGAIVSHECILGDLVNIAPNAILAGCVVIEKGVLVGMGVTINLGVQVGEWTKVGNGSTVKADIGKRKIVPAGTTWPRNLG